MAVPAIELKPRSAVALFDAAIRLCARSSGVWALTLPGGAAVTFALLQLSDALRFDSGLLVPAIVFTFAWLFRGVCMAAACHFLDEQVLGTNPPSTWRSLKAALSRLPSVLITAVYLPLFNLLSVVFTGGLAWFFLASHFVGWAVTMKGLGHPLALYGTSARLLGPAKSHAAQVRWLFTSILLVAMNLHLAANFLVYLARKLIGLDLTFAQRFISLDNGAWLIVVAALAFTLFEPLRAAVAVLLLIDGRVRQEGLDLLATVEQLPKRRAKKTFAGSGAASSSASASVSVAVAVLAGWIVALSPGVAQAQSQTEGDAETVGQTLERLHVVAEACDYQHPVLEGDALDGAAAFAPPEHASLQRLVNDVELYAGTWEDCDSAAARMDRALPQLAQSARRATQDAQTKPARERASEILARQEFIPIPKKDVEPPPDEDPDSWSRKFRNWLDKLFKDDPDDVRRREAPILAGTGMGAANAIAVFIILAVLVLVAVLLFLAFGSKSEEQSDAEVESLAVDARSSATNESALSRPPESWSSLADELAAAGRFRDAIRSLYLALLARLHHAGAVDYDPTLSNWDYCRQFRGHRSYVPKFRELTLRFDFAWYGQAEVGRDGYEAFRELTAPILADSALQSRTVEPRPASQSHGGPGSATHA